MVTRYKINIKRLILFIYNSKKFKLKCKNYAIWNSININRHKSNKNCAIFLLRRYKNIQKLKEA